MFNCLFRKLSLSSNCIERITNLGNMKNLKILSLGRNNIKSISGIVDYRPLFHINVTNNECLIFMQPIFNRKPVARHSKSFGFLIIKLIS